MWDHILILFLMCNDTQTKHVDTTYWMTWNICNCLTFIHEPTCFDMMKQIEVSHMKPIEKKWNSFFFFFLRAKKKSNYKKKALGQLKLQKSQNLAYFASKGRVCHQITLEEKTNPHKQEHPPKKLFHSKWLLDLDLLSLVQVEGSTSKSARSRSNAPNTPSHLRLKTPNVLPAGVAHFQARY